MELSEINEPPKTSRSLQEILSAIVTSPSNFYNNGKISRSFQRLLETLSNKKSEPESLYDRLSRFKRRDAKRFDRTVQIIDNLFKVPEIVPLKNYLGKTLRVETLEGFLKIETNVHNGIDRLREIFDEGQNRLYDSQLRLLNRELGVPNDEVEGKNASELDSIILREKSKLEGQVKELSKLGNGQKKSSGVKENEVLGTGNMAILGKSIGISTYLNLRKPFSKFKKDASSISNGLEGLTNQNGLKRFIPYGFKIPDFASTIRTGYSGFILRYAPAALGTVALIAAGYVLSQSMGFQVDTSVLSGIDAAQTQISSFQTHLDSLTERYTNALGVRDLAQSALQKANDGMAHFKDIIREYSIVEKGQGLWNMVQGLLTQINPDSIVSNQQVVDAVARVSEANGMMTPAEWADKFPQHAYPHGSFLANIQGNPHLLQPEQSIDIKILTQSGETAYQGGIDSAQETYRDALLSVGGLESQLTALRSEISGESPGIIEKIKTIDYRFLFRNPFTDAFTIIAATGSAVLASLSIGTSAYNKRFLPKHLDEPSPESQSPDSDYIALSTERGIYDGYMNKTSYREDQRHLQEKMAEILQRVYDNTFIGNEYLTARQIAENLSNESRSFSKYQVNHYLKKIRELTRDPALTLKNQMGIKLYTLSLFNSMHDPQIPERGSTQWN